MNHEWMRSDKKMKKGEVVEFLSMYMLIMDDPVLLPNYDCKGKYLYLLQPIGEVTKVG